MKQMKTTARVFIITMGLLSGSLLLLLDYWSNYKHGKIRIMPDAHTRIDVNTYAGQVYIEYEWKSWGKRGLIPLVQHSTSVTPGPMPGSYGMYYYSRWNYDSGAGNTATIVEFATPYLRSPGVGILALAILAPPATCLVKRLIRWKRGRCVSCGYLLKGLSHDVCPECGSPRWSSQRGT